MTGVLQKGSKLLEGILPSTSAPSHPATALPQLPKPQKTIDLILPEAVVAPAPAAVEQRMVIRGRGYTVGLTPNGQADFLERADGSVLRLGYDEKQNVVQLNDRHKNGQSVTWALDQKTNEWRANHPGLVSTQCPLTPDLQMRYADRNGSKHTIRPTGEHLVDKIA